MKIEENWLEQPFAFTEKDVEKHCRQVPKDRDADYFEKKARPKQQDTRVKLDKHVWTKSTYTPEKFVEKCSTCGCRKRGPNHNDGTQHNQRVKAR